MKRLALAFIGFFIATAALAAEPVRFIILPESVIHFTFTRDNNPHTGTLKDFSGDIVFHPEALAQSYAKINIPLGGISTQDTEAQQELKNPDWMDVAKFPAAIFETITFKHLGDNRYEAEAKLTLKGVTLPITLAFTLETFDKKRAAINGESSIKRKDFHIGWPETKMVADEVRIAVSVKAATQ
jgi:polyisoprenoid-binding protein YceI